MKRSDSKMPVFVEHSYRLPRPIAECFAYITNLNNDPIWQESCVSVDAPIGNIATGLRYHITFKFLGRNILFLNEVRSHNINDSFSYEVVDGELYFHGGYRFTEVGETETEVAWFFEFDPKNAFRLIPHRLLESAIKKQTANDVRRLQSLLSNDKK